MNMGAFPAEEFGTAVKNKIFYLLVQFKGVTGRGRLIGTSKEYDYRSITVFLSL